ncbi:futalosine hydrolase [Gynurincola endophyticus]|jgi:futalosine hydrolase|uniref:futalosine hydrolase n=1 Tax=Gynurincola endophyticus TaxID=2479004 RepID=UPI000F8D7253|nr:futalosine hydrolase [Gynurincola endophyticus]
MTSRKIALITATPFELSPALKDFQRANDQFITLHTGVGLVNMAIQCQKLIFQHQPDACILIGIAGSFNTNLPLNAVVAVQHEITGDLGVWEDHQWKDLFDLRLADPDQFPFNDKKLTNPHLDNLYLRMPAVTAVSVNEISTDANTIDRYKNTCQAAIESMEGAAFHQVMLENNIPFLQLRAISNLVGVRDKKQWSIPPAIHAVNQTCIDLLNNGLFN